MVNSFSSDHRRATILLSCIPKLFIFIYRVQLQSTGEFVDQGVHYFFQGAARLSIPPGSQSLALGVAPSFVACRVLFARGISTGLCSVLITMAMADGVGKICGHRPLWLTPLLVSAPSPVRSDCMDQTVFCSVKLLISTK